MKKQYTISTLIFNSLKEVEEKIKEWRELGTFNENSKVFEIKEEYKPVIKLVRVKKII